MPAEDKTIVHAQLTFGNGMIMLGSVKKSEFDQLMKQPDEIGGAETQTAYVVVQCYPDFRLLAIYVRNA